MHHFKQLREPDPESASQATAGTQSRDWRALLSRPDHDVRMLNDVRVPMRDGIELSADVYLPEGPGQWPVLLQRTPYGSSEGDCGPYGGAETAAYFARRGYAVVIQDVRGRFDSDGDWYAWTSEIDDGRDSLDWCGTQSWSDGNVGMFGLSYLADVQWWAAPTGSPYLKTIIPYSAHADMYFDGMNYRGGAFKLAGNLQWAIKHCSRTEQRTLDALAGDEELDADPLADRKALFDHLPIITADVAVSGRPIDFYRDWVRHSTYDEYWKVISSFGTYQNIDIPILQIGGWFDVHVVSTLTHVEGIQAEGTPRARQHHQLVMGPWVHGAPQRQLGELDFGERSMVDIYELQLRWLDRWLKQIDNGADGEPTLRLFTLGTNEWTSADRWPLPETQWTPFYLRGNGGASSQDGDGSLDLEAPVDEEAPDTYVYDPADPVPTLGEDPWDDRPIDYRSVERRQDVLVYTSEPLTEDLEVTGPVQAHIFASSSAVDTDWTVRLMDVQPDGRSINLCDGILRARFREPSAVRTAVRAPGQYEKPCLLEPEEVYEFTIEVGVLSVVFRRGHRIRAHISSSNFPRFDRNLNNGGELGIDPQIVTAQQTVYHDQEHASYIELPVIPGTRSNAE